MEGLPNCGESFTCSICRSKEKSKPKDLISLFIVDEAKHCLTETDKTISEIAYSLGFEYPAHFTRMFKRMVGISPSDYKLKMRRSDDV